jgi:signal transduction histidine kinase
MSANLAKQGTAINGQTRHFLRKTIDQLVRAPQELDAVLSRYEFKQLASKPILTLLFFAALAYFVFSQEWIFTAFNLSVAYAGASLALTLLKKWRGAEVQWYLIGLAIVLGAATGACIGTGLWLLAHPGAMVSWRKAVSETWIAAPWGMAFALIDVSMDYLNAQRTQARRAEQQLIHQKQEAAKQAAEAQLRLLQAQIEPHFLLNTLANVRSLVKRDSAKAIETIDHLSDYLHVALPRMRQNSSTLAREVLLSESYLAIMKIRMGDRLDFRFTVPAALEDTPFPPMLLQTLVENCIKHGLEPSSEGGRIDVTAAETRENNLDVIRITVADTGIGFGKANSSGTGIGLVNTRERLASLFPTGAGLEISANSPRGVIVTIVIPRT